MADLTFADGFENLTVAADKNSVFTGQTQQVGPNARGNAVEMTGTADVNGGYIFTTDAGTYRLWGFYFKPTGASGTMLRAYGSNSTERQWRLYYTATDWVLERESGITITTTPRSGDGWHYHELQINRSSSSSVRWRVDGVTIVGSGTYDCQDSGGNAQVRMYGTGYYDDMVVFNNPATDMSDMLGPVAVERLTPTSNGNHTAWTGDYTDVDEVPHSNADFITSTAAADQETYGFSSPSATPTSVAGVAFEVSGRGRDVLPLVRTGGTTADSGTLIALSEDWVYYQQQFLATNPATATAWAAGDLSSEFGLESI